MDCEDFCIEYVLPRGVTWPSPPGPAVLGCLAEECHLDWRRLVICATLQHVRAPDRRVLITVRHMHASLRHVRAFLAPSGDFRHIWPSSWLMRHCGAPACPVPGERLRTATAGTQGHPLVSALLTLCARGMTHSEWRQEAGVAAVAGWARWPVQTLYSLSGGLTGMGCAHPRFSQAPTEDSEAQEEEARVDSKEPRGQHGAHYHATSASTVPDGDSGHLSASPWGSSASRTALADGFWQVEPSRDRPAEEAEPPAHAAGTSLVPGDYMPDMSEPSALLTNANVAALAAAVPLRHRWRRWHLVYSSGRDGISLQTLYRHAGMAVHATKKLPCVLVVRDSGQNVFGCFTSETWRVAPRYYGTGESFVFQLQPNALLWPWNQRRNAFARNDFFQFGTADCLAIGGAPRYALKLDGDLHFGSSGQSDTYGCPCLASSEEFTIGRVELWGLV